MSRDWNATYVCDDCGAKDCKLWREYTMFLSHVTLHCAPCAAKDQERELVNLDAEGFRDAVEYAWCDRTDQIGWLVPAVTTEEGDTFWGYTSCPQDRIDWWRALPSMPVVTSG